MVRNFALRPAATQAFGDGENRLRFDLAESTYSMANAFNTVGNNRFAQIDPFQVNTITPNSQNEPAVAVLASGGFVAVWMSSQSVKLQLFDRQGVKIGAEFAVAAGALGDPTVVALAGGGFVVAWSDFENGEVDIWGRMFDAAGSPVASQFLMSTESFGNGSQPSLAALSSGGFVATWTAQDVQFSSSGIKGQIFDAVGSRVGAEFGVNTTTAFEQYFSLVGALPGGGFVATWTDQLNGYRGQIFDATGAKVGAEFAVGAKSGDFYSALTVLSSGNIVFAFVDPDGDISGQMFSPTGSPIGGAFKLNTIADNNHDMPALTSLPNGGFVATWREATGTAPSVFEDGEIKAQVFDANGVRIGDEFLVNMGTTGGQMTPTATAFGSNDFVIAWVDFQSSQSEILARAYFSVDTGTEGDDVFAGTSDRDFYEGLGGNDQISGSARDDGLDGGEGNDSLTGGAGNDDLAGAGGNDTLDGGEGDDLLAGGLDADVLDGGEGNDRLDGGGGADSMTGGLGNDIFYVDNAGDQLFEASGGGSDRVLASVDYTLFSGQSVEILSTDFNAGTAAINLGGNELSNIIYGNAGANILYGKGGDDWLEGLGGSDQYYVDSAGDYVREVAGGGSDRILAGGDYTLYAGQSIEVLSTDWNAGTANIALGGNELDNIIYGNAGNNILYGKGGNDFIGGLAGDDAYYIDSAGDFVQEFAGEGNDRIYAGGDYTLYTGQHIEVLSTDFNAGTAAIALGGNELNNTIYGNDGNNILYGKEGNDTLLGLGGNDQFWFNTALGATNVDTIYGFASGGDKLVLFQSAFTALTPGSLPASAFVTGTAAGDADDRIIYNSATGALLYDADGNGTGAAVQFATLAGAPVINAGDFSVI